MGGCRLYVIKNTGVSNQDYIYSACSVTGCIVTATTEPGKSYYITSEDAALGTQGSVSIITGPIGATRYLNFTGSCGDNFSLTVPAGGLGGAAVVGYFYCFEKVQNCDLDNKIDYPQQCYNLISSGLTNDYDIVDFVSSATTSDSTFNECNSTCPCEQCDSEYCIFDTNSLADDTYSVYNAYNGQPYFIGNTNGYYIFYDNIEDRWCLSSTLGGSCELFGKSPCSTDCPDLCDENFTSGICPTPTPTPTTNCDVLDFEAIFSCEVSPTPTNTPTTTPTPTNTPTPSSTSVCGLFDLSVTGITFSPTPTPTPTVTPTTTPEIDRPFNFSGNVTFNTIETQVKCPNSSKFQDCFNGLIYYTTNTIITPSGDTLTQFMIFKANVNNEIRCVSYLGIDNKVIGIDDVELLEGPIGFSNLGECVNCVPQVSQTPTPTPTPTQTPTPTSSEIPVCSTYSLSCQAKESAEFGFTNCCTGLEETVYLDGEAVVKVCSFTPPTLISGNGASSVNIIGSCACIEGCIC